MRTCNILLVVNLIFIASFPDLLAETLKVTGYVGKEVILKCQSENITQVQWDFEATNILVFNPQHGMDIKDSHLKKRVNLIEQSLKIRDVNVTDSGTYTCTLTTYPSGSLRKTINLVVTGEPGPEPNQQTQMSAGILCAIIISAVLLLGILTAAAYLTLRHKAANRLEVHIDASSHATSVNCRDPVSSEEVVYADVRSKRTRNSGSSLNKLPRASAKAEEVTYGEVKVYHQRSNLETAFSV
ncbi:uncharacterized protein LOC129371456 [Poeciliopsis prolifica]|uniref:uncharacterized protein LOC129371456 n=1 Tax=Poeciliopsis prolifica TaxID=188132 RepID=UPI0024131F30|nr:uncharacterized protein LOC129371456 [Poeciliopsis prolifica]